MLNEIRAYLSERGQAPLADIAIHLDAPPEAVRGMLSHWERKGRVARLTAPCRGGCSAAGCGGCAETGASEIYAWLGPNRTKEAPPSETAPQ